MINISNFQPTSKNKHNSKSLNGINCWNFHVSKAQNVSLKMQRAIDLRNSKLKKQWLYADCFYYYNEQSNQTPQEAENIMARNLRNATSKYHITNGWFGEPQKCKSSPRRHVRQIFTANPIGEANNFYGILARGGKEKTLEEDGKAKGVQTDFPDGSLVNKRAETSSKDSPAVEFRLSKVHKNYKPHQKLHFVKK